MPGCGHGHVYPEPNGVKARCGGPGLCSKCSIDQARREGYPPRLLDLAAAGNVADDPVEPAAAPSIELSAALVSVLAEHELIDPGRWGPGDLGHAGVCLAHCGAHTERAMLMQQAQIDGATYQLQEAPRLYPAKAPIPWKPQNPRRDLVRAAALIIAQIEQIDERIGVGIDKLSEQRSLLLGSPIAPDR